MTLIELTRQNQPTARFLVNPENISGVYQFIVNGEHKWSIELASGKTFDISAASVAQLEAAYLAPIA